MRRWASSYSCRTCADIIPLEGLWEPRRVLHALEAQVDKVPVVVGAGLGVGVDVELPSVEASRLERGQALRVQGVEEVIRRVRDAAALGARGAAAQVGGAGGPLWALILARSLHTQEPGDPLQQDQLDLQRRGRK